MEFSNNLKITIVVYLVACFLLYETKPDFMFSKDGQMKHFGLHKDETIFPYWLVTTMIGFSFYYYLNIILYLQPHFYF